MKLTSISSSYPTKNKVKRVIKHLKFLASGKVSPGCEYSGICLELEHKFNINSRSFCNYWKTWSKFSGSLVYPIGNGESDYEKCDAHLWNTHTRVGKLRCELCLHLAAELIKQVKEGVYS